MSATHPAARSTHARAVGASWPRAACCSFEKVFDKLESGGCIGIFPEGGSHDRTTLLPLKAGVAIMAWGSRCRSSTRICRLRARHGADANKDLIAHR